MGGINTKTKEYSRRQGTVQVLTRKNRVSPKLSKILEKLNKLQQEYNWISENSEKLKRTLLNKYVAVKDEKVVFYSDNFEALLKVLIASNEDVDSFALKRVTKDAACLLL